MRQSHVGGEKVFVNFSDDTIDVIDPSTGKVHPGKPLCRHVTPEACIGYWRAFGATGASSDTYAEAVASDQALEELPVTQTAMAFKLIMAAEKRWRGVDAQHLLPRIEQGIIVNDGIERQISSAA